MLEIPCILMMPTQEGENPEFIVGEESLQQIEAIMWSLEPKPPPKLPRGLSVYKGVPFLLRKSSEKETD